MTQNYVLEFKVSVYDIIFMHIVNAIENLSDNNGSSFFRKSSILFEILV